ncbi:MAG: cation-transporting P-type ATPase [Candidatus Binatia bacterium]
MPASTDRIALAPLLVGDPVRVDAPIAAPTDILDILAATVPPRAAFLPLTPGVGLVHALDADTAGLGLRIVQLPHQPVLVKYRPDGPRGGRHGALRAIGSALRVIARLEAALRSPPLVDRLATATSRAALAEGLGAIPESAGEAPIADERVLALLGTARGGLAGSEAARRLGAAGPNQLERARRRSLAARLLAQLTGLLAVLLWAGAAIALVTGTPEIAGTIVVVIVVNGLFGFAQEYRAERAVEALAALLPRTILALRDGRPTRVRTEDLVPGDVTLLQEGDQIPADAQLLAAEGLRIDEAALTGESRPIFKLPALVNRRESVPFTERHELVFAGTQVVAGSATAVVRATGMTTEIGAVAALTQEVQETPSPLERELVHVTRLIAALAVGLGGAAFLLGVATHLLSVRDGLLFALGVIVSNVPEGLLPTLTLALALGVQRMARERTLMKRLSAVETLGATTVICTDKTGTLTENRMEARVVWAAGRTWAAEAIGPDAPPEVHELLETAALASQATLTQGDPTERALLGPGARAGIDPETVRHTHPLRTPHPFDSFRKRMTLVRATPAGPVAYVKGAPKETLALCDTVRWHGGTVPLTPALRAAILGEHDRLAAGGLRLLAMARRTLPASHADAPTAEVERGLTFLGLAALWDPPRAEVPDAVALCRRAGIRIVMITGDHGLTARAIASRVGIPAARIVTGEDLDRLAPGALAALVAEPAVLFARVSPAHKLAVVTALRAAGEVVAVTGDGVNDAPALKAADIGVAMGRRGTDVAKEAAVMVITDDNFASIVTAVALGRATYANIGKFITYILTHNFAELVAFLAFILARIPLPLTVMQVLAVDLGTELAPALALGAEPPEPGVMDRPPRPRTQRLLDLRRFAHAYGFLGLLEATLALGAFFWTYWHAGWRPGQAMATEGPLYRCATTMTVAAIVAAQVGNAFACRTERESVLRAGLLRNRRLLGGCSAAVGVLLVLLAVPPLRALFQVAPLPFTLWWPLLAFPAVMLAAEEGRKAVERHRTGGAWSSATASGSGSC